MASSSSSSRVGDASGQVGNKPDLCTRSHSCRGKLYEAIGPCSQHSAVAPSGGRGEQLLAEVRMRRGDLLGLQEMDLGHLLKTP